MRTDKLFLKNTALTALLFAGFFVGGIAQDTGTIVNPETNAPTVLATSPDDGEINVNQNSVIEITFSSEMDAASINSTTLLLYATYADTLNEEYGEMQQEQITANLTNEDSDSSWHDSTGAVNGTIIYANKIAIFTPDNELKEGTTYTFTVTNGVKNSENIALDMDQSWDFTTLSASDTSRSDSSYFGKQNDRYGMDWTEVSSINTMSTEKITSIDLGNAGRFVILAKISVINNSASRITGHIGKGSVADSIQQAMDIFNPAQQTTSDQDLVLQSSQSDTTSPDVMLAIEDMISAYSDASIQKGDDSTAHNNESFHNTVLTPGVHEWSDPLHIVSDVTLSGSADDVWLIKVGENTVFTLTNGARADNIFWYVEGEVTIGENAHFEGIILPINDITLEKGAKLTGRLFSQTSITLDDNTVNEPGSMAGPTSSTNR